jgi:hypothetical protein
MKSAKGRVKVLRAGDYNSNTFIAAPREARALREGKADLLAAKFEVTYKDFTAEAKKAFQAAVDIWAVTLTTGVTIRISATWTKLGDRVLGSAGATVNLSGFEGAPKKDTWYPVALASKLAGKDLRVGKPHISASFNSGFDWYFGTDGKCPAGKYDLMSVVLHEIGHGLGFSGSAAVKDGKGSWGSSGQPEIWDVFIQNGKGKKITDTASFPNSSKELAEQLQGGDLFFAGAEARKANGGSNVRIYAPASFDEGSSFSHKDETTFPAGNANSLMTPRLGKAEAIHDPGPVGIAILRDLGW